MDQSSDGRRLPDNWLRTAPGRALYPNPTSEYYQMEPDEIGKAEYPNYFRVHIEEP